MEALEHQGTSYSLDQYIWSLTYVDAPLVRIHDGNADGDLWDSGVDNLRYYTWDANHNVTTMVTADPSAGSTTEHVAYTAYGVATLYSADFSTGLGTPSESGPLYCGYFFDAETGLYQVRNRYYDSSLAVWISRDPVAADINLYCYCGAKSTANSDPSGNEPDSNSGPELFDPSLSVVVHSTKSHLSVKCGEEASATWSYYTLSAPLESGYIVQQVDVLQNIQPCVNGSSNCPKSVVLIPSYTYWEAFPVAAHGGSVVDTASFTPPDNTSGYYIQHTELRFYPKSTTQNLENLWGMHSSFPEFPNQPNGIGSLGPILVPTSPGAIPATDKRPTWWGTSPGAADYRTFSVSWDCCPASQKHVDATASPSQED